MYAMLLARFKMFPEVKEKGMSSVPRLAAFTSEHVGIYVSIHLINIPTALPIRVLLDQIMSVDHSFLQSNVKDLPLQCRNNFQWFCTLAVAVVNVCLNSDFVSLSHQQH